MISLQVILLFVCLFGVTSSSAQNLPLPLLSEIIPGIAQGQYVVPGIDPRLTFCKAITLPAIL